MPSGSAKAESPHTGRQRLLFQLKTKGPMTAARLARRLGITSMAVHQQLTGLRDEGLVDFTKERHKVGRPAHLWMLTPQAHDRFPDGHAELAVGMLRATQSAFGEKGLEQLVNEWTRQQIQSYRKRIPKVDAPVEERVGALARIRGSEGFMAEWGRSCDGSIEFVEHHCSISKAARLCPHLCKGELALFRAVLGKDVSIDRIEHVLEGDSRCAYRIASHPNGTTAEEETSKI